MYDWIIANKELLKVIYALIITFICAIIVLKTDRLFKISEYNGLRYFRNAFFFYGAAFIIRFIIGGVEVQSLESYVVVIKILFEFSIITAGFLLLYSLIWKNVEKQRSYHSFFNKNMFIIYIISAVLVSLDFLWNTTLFMYLSQIMLFSIMVFLSYNNVKKSDGESPFLKYYFFTMVLGLLAWVLNTFLEHFLNWNKPVQIIVYSLNIVFFLLFLYGALNITKQKKHGKKKRTT